MNVEHSEIERHPVTPMADETTRVEPLAQCGPTPVPGVSGISGEPPVGTVLAYRLHMPVRRPVVTGPDAGVKHTYITREYHYASIRAGDGLWYTTGRHAEQGVDWRTLSTVLRESGAEVYAASTWAVFEP